LVLIITYFKSSRFTLEILNPFSGDIPNFLLEVFIINRYVDDAPFKLAYCLQVWFGEEAFCVRSQDRKTEVYQNSFYFNQIFN